MTEIQNVTVATVETAAVAVRSPRAFSGILSNIATTDLESGKLVLATLTTESRVGTTVRTLSISGEALERVQDVLVEGASVRLFGREGEAYVSIIGLDLTKRTLARQAAQVATAPASGVVTDKKTGRILSEREIASRKAYGERLRKGREAAAARRAAESMAVEG